MNKNKISADDLVPAIHRLLLKITARLHVITALPDSTFVTPLGSGYASNEVSTEGVMASDKELDKM